MTLVQLRHFIALAETASFRRAAEATFLTQPALSRSIKGLEDELGQPLFDRIGWRTELTPFGREMLARAQRLVAEAEHLKESAERLQAGKSGRIRIGLGSGPGAILTMPLMQHVALHLPGAHIDIAHGQTVLLAQGLRERQLDALVVDARSLPPAQDLHVQPLGELRGTFMVRPGHPLLAQRAPLRFRDLRRYPLATTPLSDEIGRIMVERYGPEAHLDECVTLRTEDIPTLVRVAMASDAVLLAVRAAAPGLEELSVKPALAASARFGLVTLAGRSMPPLLEELRPMIETLLTE